MLTAYYDSAESQMEALRQRTRKAEEKNKHLAQEAARATEAAKASCCTLRLALTDMGAKAGSFPGEDASVLDFWDWSQEAGCAVSDCATVYGDCCARVSAAFALGLLQQNWCEHVARFPELVKGDWEVSSQDISPTLRAW
uniref:Uncharacterized protein n=1 Tax=Oryza punctata TaxID=4537 RepID=A0A0E0KN72_ORYPU